MTLYAFGNPLNGGTGADHLLDHSDNAANNMMNGGDGDDVLLGDFGAFNSIKRVFSANSFGSAINVDSASTWYVTALPYIATGGTPHTSVYYEGRANEQMYLSFTATIGSTITLDIDFGTTASDAAITLYNLVGSVLGTGAGGTLDIGSRTKFDPSLTFIATYSGTHYVRIGTSSGNFIGNEAGILNISVSGHANAGGLPTGDDVLNGGNGNDYLFAGAYGIDTLNGGAGEDTIISNGGGSVSAGSEDDFVFAGLGASELLDGGTGDDTLDVRTWGGTYFVNLVTGVTSEAGESFTNFENLIAGDGDTTAIGTSGTNQIIGGAGTDYLIGGDGNDWLVGGGVTTPGQGNSLQGGRGNDVYIVSVREDSTLEFADEGLDAVGTTFFIYGLQNNIEQLSFLDDFPHGAGVGNALDNIIEGGRGADDLFGREGNDRIDGGAGAANTLLGQQGDDYYVVRAIGDSIIEFAGEGIDTVSVRPGVVSFTLGANVENLEYLGGAPFIGVGNGLANEISGYDNDDQLNGLGGNDIIWGYDGNDLIQLGSGADQLRYQGQEFGLDRVLDFLPGTDKVGLRDISFAQTAVIDFVQSGAPAPVSNNSTFMHNVNSGIIAFDVDGLGPSAPFLMAQLNPGLTLFASDFIFY